MTCCSNFGAMTGRYGSQSDSMRVDSEVHSSEGETEDVTFISSNTSFKTEDADIRIDDDDACFLTPSSPLPLVEEEVSQPVTTSLSLTPEQQQVLDYVQAGENVFFTGSGGMGKTLVLQQILKFFKRKYPRITTLCFTWDMLVDAYSARWLSRHQQALPQFLLEGALYTEQQGSAYDSDPSILIECGTNPSE